MYASEAEAREAYGRWVATIGPNEIDVLIAVEGGGRTQYHVRYVDDERIPEAGSAGKEDSPRFGGIPGGKTDSQKKGRWTK